MRATTSNGTRTRTIGAPITIRVRKQRGTTIRMRSAGLFLLFFSVWMPFFHYAYLQPYADTMADSEGSTVASILATSKVSSSTVSLMQLPFQPDGQSSSNKNNKQQQQYSLEHPPENSPYTILHTVTSRFMVGQAPNITYGRQFEIQQARYLLFETFCWPTVKHQTSSNFYWLVLVDPGLDERIIGGMKDLMSSTEHFPDGNAFLVLTNNTEWSSDGIGVENSTSYGVGLQPVAQEFKDGNLEILTGNTDYLLRALDWMDGKNNNNSNVRKTPNNDENKPLMVIETLLDTDDGLNNHAVEWIQDTAIQRTKEHWDHKQQHLVANNTNVSKTALRQSSLSSLSSTIVQQPSLNATWWFLCGTDHIEWHNREIFQLMDEEYAKIGITSGLAGLRKAPLFCTSAGFTRIGITVTPPKVASDSDSSDYSHMVFPKEGYSNHALAFLFPECTTTTDVVSNGNYSACWHREYPGEAFIIKSRTITSDSMDHLNVAKAKDYRDVSWLNASDYPLLTNDTAHMWDILSADFSIDQTNAQKTSAYIFEHRRSILHQNKQTRCTPGFPCYKTARKNLLRMERYWLKKEKTKRQIQKQKAAEALAAAKKAPAAAKKARAGKTPAKKATPTKKKNGDHRVNIGDSKGNKTVADDDDDFHKISDAEKKSLLLKKLEDKVRHRSKVNANTTELIRRIQQGDI